MYHLITLYDAGLYLADTGVYVCVYTVYIIPVGLNVYLDIGSGLCHSCSKSDICPLSDAPAQVILVCCLRPKTACRQPSQCNRAVCFTSLSHIKASGCFIQLS